ncbi:IclR family transcriptional regulator, partial [Amycolatopsis jejuensis]|uniref:IclR family transcriptional regulator n=1 Tax=Amycolatopsis jejuensis TaxID=330084 RepID=UPI003CCBC15F
MRAIAVVLQVLGSRPGREGLSGAGFVEQDPDTRAYRLGWQPYVLGRKAGDQLLLNAGSAVLRAMVRETGETALLSVLDGDKSLTLLREQPDRTIQAAATTRQPWPLHIAASGRALMLDMSDEEVRDLISADISRTDAGPGAKTSVAEVLDTLHRERQTACCIAIDELEAGHMSIAAPVRD